MKKKGLILLTTLLFAGGAFASISAVRSSKIVNEAKADIVENGFRVIYYYIDSNWQYGEESGRRFERGDGGDAYHYYVYTVNGVDSAKQYFGEGTSSNDAYSEVIADCAAKIYLPTDVEAIYFGSEDGDNDNYLVETQTLSSGDGKEAFVVTSNQSQVWPAEHKKQSGIWVSKDTFFSSYLKYIYYTCSSAWIGSEKGPATLQDTYVYIDHFGSDGTSNIKRIYKMNSSMLVTLDGFTGTYAKILVSAKSGAVVRLQKTYQNNPWNNYRSQSITTTSYGSNNIINVYGYTTGNSEQSTSVSSFLNANDYIFFTPTYNWGSGSQGFRVCTYGENDAAQESYEALTKLTENKFGGFFTSKDVYWYQLTKPCYSVRFLRWDPDYMGDTAEDKDTSHQYNYSGQCAVNGSFWLDASNYNSSWSWDGWTDASDGVSWSAVGSLVAKVGDIELSDGTGRIFFNNTGSAWSVDGKCAVAVTSPTIRTSAWTYLYVVLEWFQDNDEVVSSNPYYGYADIPLDIDGFHFTLLADGNYGATKWNDQYQISWQNGSWYTRGDFPFVNGSCSNVYYGSTNGTGDAEKPYLTVSMGGAKDDYARTTLCQKVLEAIDTCSDNVHNGYGAYTDLNANIFTHATSTALAAVVTTRSGEKPSLAMSVADHIAAMSSRSINGLPSSGTRIGIFKTFFTEDNGATVGIIAAVSAVSLAALAFFYIKKRKHI